jgi:hypothetical protein
VGDVRTRYKAHIAAHAAGLLAQNRPDSGTYPERAAADGTYLAKVVRPNVPNGGSISCGLRRSSGTSPGGVAQSVERVLYHSTPRAVPERSWVH